MGKSEMHKEKAKQILLGRGYHVEDHGDRLVIDLPNGAHIPVLVKYRDSQHTIPVVSGSLIRLADGSYDDHAVRANLLPGGFTVGFVMGSIYVVPHDEIIVRLSQWLSHRRGQKHTLELNFKNAQEIGLDLNGYRDAWHLIPAS